MANLGKGFSVQVLNDHTDEFLAEFAEKKKKVLVQWGEGTEGQAKAQIESDPRRVDTGRLKGSITYATTEKRDTPEGPAEPKDAVDAGAADKDSVVIGSNVEYAAYVHNGTISMRPNRFLTDAYENLKSRGEYEKVLREEMSSIVL